MEDMNATVAIRYVEFFLDWAKNMNSIALIWKIEMESERKIS